MKNKKGYLKIHVAVNVKTKKKILSIKVTDEHVHDSKVLPELVRKHYKIKIMLQRANYLQMVPTIVMVFLDVLQTMESCLALYQSKKKNAKVRWKKGNIFRNLSVLAQRNDLQKWKDSSVRYDGQRWIIETMFSYKENI